MKIYNIIYKRDERIEKLQCSKISVDGIKAKIEKDGGEIIEIKEIKNKRKKK